eukprot:m.131760 g.131760  ORF g.131760 m.131760 type:complete len:241 (+) comp20035_c4_seq3:639-1361(+)
MRVSLWVRCRWTSRTFNVTLCQPPAASTCGGLGVSDFCTCARTAASWPTLCSPTDSAVVCLCNCHRQSVLLTRPGCLWNICLELHDLKRGSAPWLHGWAWVGLVGVCMSLLLPSFAHFLPSVDYLFECGGTAALQPRIQSLGQHLRAALCALSDCGVKVEDKGDSLGGIVSFSLAHHQPTAVQESLQAKRVNVSVSPPASTPLDTQRWGLGAVLRASVHAYNTLEELDQFCGILRSVLQK